MNPFATDPTAAPACTCLDARADACPRHFPAAHFLGMRTAPNAGQAEPSDPTQAEMTQPGPETIEITPSGRTIHAEMGAAMFRPAKTSPPRPEIGPLALLLASTRLIHTHPTTEQWQTLKQAILELPHAH